MAAVPALHATSVPSRAARPLPARPGARRAPARRGPAAPRAAPSPDSGSVAQDELLLISETERFVMEMQEAEAAQAAAGAPPPVPAQELRAQLAALEEQVRGARCWPVEHRAQLICTFVIRWL